MFETTVIARGNTRVATRSAALLPVSLALHTLVVAGAIFGAVWNVSFPQGTPTQFSTFSMMQAVPTPPPAPLPPRGSSTPVQTQTPRQIVPDAAPTMTPESIPDLPAASSASGSLAGSDSGQPGGVAGGQEGGVDGGVENSVTLVPVTPAPVDNTIYQVGGNVSAPKLIHQVRPEYPTQARLLRKQGVVLVEAIIDRQGMVRDVKVVQTPFEPLGQAAVDAVMQWRFSPGTLGGRPVDTQFRLKVEFKLSR